MLPLGIVLLIVLFIYITWCGRCGRCWGCGSSQAPGCRIPTAHSAAGRGGTQDGGRQEVGRKRRRAFGISAVGMSEHWAGRRAGWRTRIDEKPTFFCCPSRQPSPSGSSTNTIGLRHSGLLLYPPSICPTPPAQAGYQADNLRRTQQQPAREAAGPRGCSHQADRRCRHASRG